MAESVRRGQLIETALRLFYRHGFHATGIDRVLAEAGIALHTAKDHVVFERKEVTKADGKPYTVSPTGRPGDFVPAGARR